MDFIPCTITVVPTHLTIPGVPPLRGAGPMPRVMFCSRLPSLGLSAVTCTQLPGDSAVTLSTARRVAPLGASCGF